MRILFLDQSGKPGGAELCLLDIASQYGDRPLIGLFADGPFRALLEQHRVPVRVLAERAINVNKGSNLLQGLSSITQVVPLISQVVQLSRQYDAIYANTQKALVVGAIASGLSQRPLVYHLHDIVSPDHFSSINRRLIVGLANQFASCVIANSQASATAFIAAGGRAELVEVVYNGFNAALYQHHRAAATALRHALGLGDRLVIGHFSRLSPWKGQHVLIDALSHCSPNVVALFVGDALFGEEAYADQLRQQVAALGLGDRVHFLGFRDDIPQLMTLCDLVAHTSTAPEPFGRVIVEAMLCGTPVVAAAAGGVMELVEPGQTGWLTPPSDADALAQVIQTVQAQPEQTRAIAHHAQMVAAQRFELSHTNAQIDRIMQQLVPQQQQQPALQQ
ncbi:MAG: glycosyltransferase [Kaiparowitsia implicata GSE-PSE-MK54-09C]|jgi:glycosyltransferase involved in cell wall biosynthesis|nr:glycosyltransferase [Kaiparowitsia implicata GSE-PSE-MK54-09C]